MINLLKAFWIPSRLFEYLAVGQVQWLLRIKGVLGTIKKWVSNPNPDIKHFGDAWADLLTSVILLIWSWGQSRSVP